MLNLAELAAFLVPIVLGFFVLYWAVRLGVAAGIRTAMPDVLQAEFRGNRE